MPKNEANKVLNMGNFTTKTTSVKSPINEIVSSMVRLVNKHKMNYDQLSYATKQVRLKCGVKHPKRPKKLPQMPTKEELRTTFYQCIHNPIHKLIFEVLEGSGLRVSELANLKVSDIDFDDNTLFINQGKGHQDRKAVIGNKVLEKLKIYLEGRNNTYLFESNRNTKYSTRRIQQLCTQYAKQAKIAHVIHCHTFRHIFITYLTSQNIGREIREIIVGHSKGSKAHDIYNHLSAGGIDKNEIIKVLDKDS